MYCLYLELPIEPRRMSAALNKGVLSSLSVRTIVALGNENMIVSMGVGLKCINCLVL